MPSYIASVTAAIFGTTVASAVLMGAVLCALFLTFLAVYPVLNFFMRGWAIKKQDIFSSFNSDAKHYYLQSFLKTDPSDDADGAFEAFYERCYGRKRFIFPLILFTLVCFALSFVFSETAISQISVCVVRVCTPVGLQATPKFFLILVQPVAAAGIIGGYLWVVAGFINSSRAYDLLPADVLNGTLRLTLAAAIGYAISSIGNPSVAPFVAFAAGAFPLSSVNVILRRLASKQMGLDIDVTNQPDQITILDGVDSLTADQLHDSGITTIPEMAYCDPVQLCMRTGLAFDFISDVSAQALAWNYFGDKLKILKACGLRTSIEIKNLYDDAKAGVPQAVATAGAAAALVQLDVALFLNACYEIAGDPYTEFLTKLWGTALND